MMGAIGGLRFSYWNAMNAAEGLRKTRLPVDRQCRTLLGVGVRHAVSGHRRPPANCNRYGDRSEGQGLAPWARKNRGMATVLPQKNLFSRRKEEAGPQDRLRVCDSATARYHRLRAKMLFVFVNRACQRGLAGRAGRQRRQWASYPCASICILDRQAQRRSSRMP
jgi:hypothetical protein